MMQTTALSSRLRLSGSGLKLLAAVIMLIDHTGAVFLTPLISQAPDTATAQSLYTAMMVCRCIGRIAFPIFCFLLAEGARYTHSIQKYTFRLFLFALLSEIPFNLAMNASMRYQSVFNSDYQSVFFTLLLGLLAIWCMESIRRAIPWKPLGILLAVCAAIVFITLGNWLKTDYSGYGVCLILLFYYIPVRWRAVVGLCSALLFFPLEGFIAILTGLSAIPLALYDGTRGKLGQWGKYWFYAFYPVHLLILAIITFLVVPPLPMF